MGLSIQPKKDSANNPEREDQPPSETTMEAVLLGGTTANSFILFSKLPVELRLEIWHHAAESLPRCDTSAGMCIVTTGKTMEQGFFGIPYERTTLCVSVARAPCFSLLRACRESREAIRRVPAPTRPYDLERDMLYVPSAHHDEFFKTHALPRLSYMPWPCFKDVRHLAIMLQGDMSVVDNLFRVVYAFRRLKRVTLVCTNSCTTVWEVDAQLGTEILKERPGEGVDVYPILRRLTPDELKRLQVRVDYNTCRGSDLPNANLTKSAWEYIKDVKEELDSRFAALGLNRRLRPPNWDYEGKTWKLKYEVRYIV